MEGQLMSSKVLVVDDSGVMRKIIVRSLNVVGVTDIVEAEDGEQAFKAFQAEPFDLVLTDWNMPVRGGLDLVNDIRATGSQVPIIMVTTESERDRVLEAIKAGANDYLAKPFEASVLREKLERHVCV
jgi:two-component system chemotaxis response regulator CheY